jgi:hypothetical protein
MAQGQVDARGSLTLPYEVEWQGQALPASSYTLEIERAVPPGLITVRNTDGPRPLKIIATATAISKTLLRQSALRIVTVDGTHHIQPLDLSNIGASFIYQTRKSRRQKSRSAEALGANHHGAHALIAVERVP